MKSSPHQPSPYVKLKHPEWTKNATIYQINTRQFTSEGTFRAAEAHLPRLKELGVDILWLMPIHEIGVKNRKGSLGSPYAVRDYYSVNTELGTLDDLKNFVDAVHAQGMYVILDWVANHTAWDNVLVDEHPEWYLRDWKGDFHPTTWWNWDDIIDLDYDNPAVREYMTEVMKYWVRDVDVDGFRCDVAGFVPTDFWNNVRKELDAIKPVFMLAEWESRDLHAEAFDMTYAWSFNDYLHKICTQGANLSNLFVYYSWNEKAYPHDAFRMTFTSNHDKNAWEGTMFEQFGDGLEAAIVLSVVGEGLPLIYNGQEAGNERRLSFFDKDQIEWREHLIGDLFKKLFTLKKANSALWNGAWGARMIPIENNVPNQVFSFVRQNDKEKVFTIINFSAQEQEICFKVRLHQGKYTDYFTQQQTTLDHDFSLTLPAWGYKVYVK